MPVIVTTLLALGSYAATVLARRTRRPDRLPGQPADGSRGAKRGQSAEPPTRPVAAAADLPRRDAA